MTHKTHSFFTSGIFAHIITILFIALYTTLDDMDMASIQIEGIGLILERDMLLHGVTFLALILLYISYTLKLNWSVQRFEESIMILVIWAWLGNITHGSFLIQSVTPCHQMGINETVVVASDVVNHHPPHEACGGGGNWNLFNVYFACLCLFTSIMSFLCDTRHYCLSFFFRTLTVLTTILIFVVPIACNRFRLTSTPILILKVTLYNLAWHMHRYMRDLQGDIVGDYNRATLIMRTYDSVYTSLMTTRVRRLPASHYMEKQQQHRYHYDDSNSEEEDGEEDDDDHHYDDDDDYDEYEEGRRVLRIKRNPLAVFKTLEKTNTMLKKVPYSGRKNHKQGVEPSRQEQQMPYQITNFTQLYKINRRHRPSCFFSWKNRAYDDRISDIARTVWILAICPSYLFVALLFIIGLGYYIRRNVTELESTNKTLSIMEKTLK